MGPATTTRPPQNSNVIKMVNTRKRRSSAEAGRYSELDNDTDPATVKRARGGKTSRGGKGLGRGLGGAGGVRRGGRGEGRGAGGLHRRPGSRGLHDMYNSQTWKCAICGQYDPIGEDDDGDTTEWIGCDCNRCVHPECPDLLWLGGFTSKLLITTNNHHSSTQVVPQVLHAAARGGGGFQLPAGAQDLPTHPALQLAWPRPPPRPPPLPP